MNCDQMLRYNLVLYQRYDQSDQHNKKTRLFVRRFVLFLICINHRSSGSIGKPFTSHAGDRGFES